jgi:selT/selW/selH-like putative selenoprotein
MVCLVCAAIQAKLPDVKVSGGMGRGSSFEVTVNGMLAFSKLAAGRFPDFNALAEEVAAYASSGAVPAHWRKA